MRNPRAAIITAFAILLVAALTRAHAQTPTQHYDKDGLAFDYPNGWTLTDQSNKDLQQLTLARSDSEAQIGVFVHRGKVDTPEKMARAKTAFIDPYIKSIDKMFIDNGAKTEQSTASTQVGAATAEGVHLRASFGGETGEAGIYWLTIGNRVVMLTFQGPDAALKKAAPAWDSIRNSLHIAETKPPEKTAPK